MLLAVDTIKLSPSARLDAANETLIDLDTGARLSITKTGVATLIFLEYQRFEAVVDYLATTCARPEGVDAEAFRPMVERDVTTFLGPLYDAGLIMRTNHGVRERWSLVRSSLLVADFGGAFALSTDAWRVRRYAPSALGVVRATLRSQSPLLLAGACLTAYVSVLLTISGIPVTSGAGLYLSAAASATLSAHVLLVLVHELAHLAAAGSLRGSRPRGYVIARAFVVRLALVSSGPRRDAAVALAGPVAAGAVAFSIGAFIQLEVATGGRELHPLVTSMAPVAFVLGLVHLAALLPVFADGRLVLHWLSSRRSRVRA